MRKTISEADARFVSTMLKKQRSCSDIMQSSATCPTLVGRDKQRALIAVAIYYIVGERSFMFPATGVNSFAWRLGMLFTQPPPLNSDWAVHQKQKQLNDTLTRASRANGLHAISDGRITLTPQPALDALAQKPKLYRTALGLYLQTIETWHAFEAIKHIQGPKTPGYQKPSSRPTLVDVEAALRNAVAMLQPHNR